MILSHIKQSFSLKTEDGEYFNDIFKNSKESPHPELLENKRDIVLRFTESIYLNLDPFYEEKLDKNSEKSQIYEKNKASHSQIQQMMLNFVEVFKTKEQIYFSLEILGNAFIFVGEESQKATNSSNYPEKIYEKALEFYRVLLLLLPKLGFRENLNYLKLEKAVFPAKLVLEEEDKQKLFRLAVSHLSLAFEKIENLSKKFSWFF